MNGGGNHENRSDRRQRIHRSKLVPKLREHGHEAIAASPNSGVNTLTGEGLAEVLEGALVVVDVSNSPSWEDSAVLNFFETSTRNLLKYGAKAGVKHFVALSVVGTERLYESGYFRAKIAQENLIKNSSTVPYSIVQATQFFEFLKGIADISMQGDKVHLPPMPFQPMAGNDVAVVKKINMPEDPWPKMGIAAAGGHLNHQEMARAAIELVRKHQPLYLNLKYYREDAEKWFADTSIVEQLLQGLRKAGLKDFADSSEQYPSAG